VAITLLLRATVALVGGFTAFVCAVTLLRRLVIRGRLKHLRPLLVTQLVAGDRAPSAMLPGGGDEVLMLTGIAQQLAPKRLDQLRCVITAAGLDPSRTEELMWSQVTWALMGLVLGLVVSFNPFVALVTASITGWMPLARVRRLGESRKQEAWPVVGFAIEMFMLASEAGFSTSRALEIVSRHVPGVLGDELRRSVRMLNAGFPLPAALGELSERIDLPVLSGVTSVVLQSHLLGTSHREVLREQLAIVREQYRLHQLEKINALPLKLTLVTIFCFLPAILVVTVLPHLLTFMQAQW